MSFLDLPRINFAGLFEADVNTVNNDVRNYAVDEFQARFQTEMKTLANGNTEYNGWWNPRGTNRFSLIGCKVTGVVADDGKFSDAGETLGWSIQAQFDRTAGKIVDLDPQFQMASALWGHRFGLVANGETVVVGDFLPASFRDLFFGRLSDAAGNPVGGSPGASARFTGVLENLEWSPSASASPILTALERCAAANGQRVSFSLVTYGYSKWRGDAALTGSVIGSIGPWRNVEPLSFALGRRFAPSGDQANKNAPFASASNIGYSTALVSENGARLTVDFGICLPLQLAPSAGGPIAPQDLGPITVAVAKQGDVVTQTATGLSVTPGVVESQKVGSEEYETIGVVDSYDVAWLQTTGGVVDFDVPGAARALIADHPLLLLIPGKRPNIQIVAIREAFGGLWARADNFVQRVDAAPNGWVPADIYIWAMRWGKPWGGAPLAFSLPPVSDQGNTGDAKEVKPPQVDTPDNNLPLAKIIVPTVATAGDDGVARVIYWVADPGNPRRYIDGQIYQISYAPAVTGISPPPTFEVVATHVRDSFVPPVVPSWETDVKPVLVQYSNLYPIMSQGLFSLADPDAVSANARLLHLAFTRPATYANFMPATRDLSAAKLRMIVDWLKSYLPPGAEGGYGAIPPLPVGQALPATTPGSVPPPSPAAVSPAVARAAAAALGPGADGKTAAARAFLKNAARRGGP
jgi:hypothetical protein